MTNGLGDTEGDTLRGDVLETGGGTLEAGGDTLETVVTGQTDVYVVPDETHVELAVRTTLLGTNGGVVANIGEGEMFAVVSTKKNAEELLDELFEVEETVLDGEVLLANGFGIDGGNGELELELAAGLELEIAELELEIAELELDIAIDVLVVVVLVVV